MKRWLLSVWLLSVWLVAFRGIKFCYAFSAAALLDQMLLATTNTHSAPVSMLALAVFSANLIGDSFTNVRTLRPLPFFDDFGKMLLDLLSPWGLPEVRASSPTTPARPKKSWRSTRNF